MEVQVSLVHVLYSCVTNQKDSFIVEDAFLSRP